MSGLLSSGGPAVEFKEVGTRFRGVIQTITELEDRDPATGRTRTYDNGDPRKVYAVNCQPEDPARFGGEEVVTLWVRSGMVKAFREAAKRAKVKNLDQLPGSLVDVLHSGLGEAKRGQNPPKEWQVTLTPGFAPVPSPDEPEEPW